MFSVRGTDFEIGDCLFVRVRGAELRFGNVEDASAARICVSFTLDHSRKRETPEWFDPSEVLRYDEIDASPPGQFAEVGLTYVLQVARDRVRVVRVISVDEPNALAEVAPVLLDSAGSLGKPESLNAGALYPPVLFAKIARWRYEQPSHPLVDVFQACGRRVRVVRGGGNPQSQGHCRSCERPRYVPRLQRNLRTTCTL